jgi:AraC-like DNA-binding protein
VVFEAHQSAVHGVGTRRYVAHLAERGWALGVKFRPGGFSPFGTEAVVALTARQRPVAEAWGVAGAALAAAVRAQTTADDAVALVETFLEARRSPTPADVHLAMRAAALAGADRAITRSRELAAAVGCSPRTLERLFRRHVGVGPKWVIQRARLHEAAERVKAGGRVDWAALAHELGYFDQAHLTRDFTAHIGRSPAKYAAWCRASTITAPVAPPVASGPRRAPE